MNHTRGTQFLSQLLGVEEKHVDKAFRVATGIHARAQGYSHLTAQQFNHLLSPDRHTLAVVANLAMRFAGRIEDAQLLMDVYKASEGVAAHRATIRKGFGAHPAHHDNPFVQQVIRILQAADLPPVHIDGIHALHPGFQVLPGCDGGLPGWVFIVPDPDCEDRSGFAGGRLGYLAVMRWAGWGVITEPLDNDLYATCHPDYRHQPFPS